MLNIQELSSELQKVAETELGEVPERIASDLKILKTWIEQEPHLKARTDDQFLIQFLRGCKYSLEKAKAKIDLFFTIKSKFPEMFNATDVNEPVFRDISNHGFVIPLPLPLNENGARIYYTNFGGDIGKGLFDAEKVYQVSAAVHEIILMEDPYACINGTVYIMNFKDITINFASKFTPSFLKKIAKFYENSMPLRIKRIYMINTPTFFHSVINILLPMFSEKLSKRVSVCGENYENMLKDIPLKYLPTHLGGENGSVEQLLKDFDKKWSKYENYFRKLGVD